jgi:hypothetical protein
MKQRMGNRIDDRSQDVSVNGSVCLTRYDRARSTTINTERRNSYEQ